METAKLKRFAQYARRNLIDQVTSKLTFVLGSDSPARREHPDAVVELEKTIREDGKDAVIDRVAYIWFNRFCALRFMDVNRYTPINVLSALPGQFQPEILAEAKMGHIDENMISRAVRQKVEDLLSGKTPSRDAQGEAYRLLIVAVCNYWNTAMPFLFQQIEDYTELLLMDDLLSGNSILAYVREAMTPDVCKDVEVIGWLYQFYISEKKDEVMGKTVKTEDIPAATQLFTPDWIVRYLVENSLGRLWMLNNPNSKLTDHMPYYIPPEDNESEYLKVSTPEELKVCDPCCGSGHMLVYAFDLLYAIYEETGVEVADIPSKILKHNLYGIEIDKRAGSLAAFALMMKARAKQRRLFSKKIEPNICILQNIIFKDEEVKEYMNFIDRDLFTTELQSTLSQFENATCFGSLIVPSLINASYVLDILEKKEVAHELFLRDVHLRVLTVIKQAQYLSQRYHVVVTNPPYMGGKGMNADLKKFAGTNYSDSKSDLFAMFIERGFGMILNKGYSAMVTMQSWMFLSSYEKLRSKLLNTYLMECLAHMANMVMGIAFGTSATVWQKHYTEHHKGAFCFVEYEDIVDGKPKSFPPDNERNRAARRQNQ